MRSPKVEIVSYLIWGLGLVGLVLNASSLIDGLLGLFCDDIQSIEGQNIKKNNSVGTLRKETKPYASTPERDLKNAVADTLRRLEQAKADKIAKQTEQSKKKAKELAAIGHRINEIIAGNKDLNSLTPEQRKGLERLLTVIVTAGRILGATPEEKAKLSFADRIACNRALEQLKTKEARETIQKVRQAIKNE